MTAIKGYVVRGKRSDGTNELIIGPTPTEARDFAVVRGCTDVAIFRVHADGTEERLPSYEEALAEIERLRAEIGEAHDAIFEAAPQVSAPLAAQIRSLVADLTAPAVDPLTALEAAERRLLEAGGWRQIEPDAYGGEQWQHEKHGRECRMVALTIARKAGVK